MSHHQADNVSTQPFHLAHGPHDPALQPVPVANLQEISLIPSVDSDDTWNSAVRLWQADRMPHAKVLREVNRHVEHFTAIIGDQPLSGLTVAHVRHFRETCIVRDETARKRVDTVVALLASVVNVAMRDRVTALRQNPFTAAQTFDTPVTNGTGSFGGAFTTDELNRFYTSPVYTQDRRPRKGGLEAAFWLPLLGQFTGARLEDLCRLRGCDVVQRDGVWCPSLRDIRRERRLGQPLAGRTVPLHRTLIELGWLDFVETCRRFGDTSWLFPDLCVTPYGGRSAVFATWFGSYLDDSGLGGRYLTFRSFRSTFAAFAKRSGLCDDAVQQFLGFAPGINVEGKEAGVEYLQFELLVQAMTHSSPPTSRFMRHYKRFASRCSTP